LNGKEIGKSGPGPAKVGSSGLLLALQPADYGHRGILITSKVEGLQILDPENGIFFNGDDAKALGVREGDIVTLKAGVLTGSAPVKIEPELKKGTICLYVPDTYGGLADRKDLADLYRLDTNPCPVEVIKHGV